MVVATGPKVGRGPQPNSCSQTVEVWTRDRLGAGTFTGHSHLNKRRCEQQNKKTPQETKVTVCI